MESKKQKQRAGAYENWSVLLILEAKSRRSSLYRLLKAGCADVVMETVQSMAQALERV